MPSQPLSAPGSPARWGNLGATLALAFGVAGMVGAAGAQLEPGERELTARTRILPGVGSGLRALKRDAHGQYYVLCAPGAAVTVYDSAGKRMAQFPAVVSKSASLVYGSDMDLDSQGRVYVADRGAGAVKVFAPDGSLAQTIPITLPASLAVLPGGELAVGSVSTARLVTVYDLQGKELRSFGDPSDVADREELNRSLNIGRLASDPAGHIYYAFEFLPEPTIRKYDRYGYAAYEIVLATPEYQPKASAMRRAILRLGAAPAPNFEPLINAVGVDPETQQVWAALGNQLVLFDRDGNRRASYRTYTAEGVALAPTAILIEADRLLLACDPLGIFEFSRPDKTASPTPH